MSTDIKILDKKIFDKKPLDGDKANQYNDLAQKLHSVDLRDRYHAKLAKKEENAGMYGLGKTKRLKYG